MGEANLAVAAMAVKRLAVSTLAMLSRRGRLISSKHQVLGP